MNDVKRKHPLAECENCSLYERGVFVPTKQPTGTVALGMPRIGIVGEAPGFQEAQRRVPFSGPSGKLLDRVLDYHGIERDEVLLTNACLCRPPDNATPEPSDVAACGKRLVAEIQEAAIDRILALGNVPSKYLMATNKGITSARIGPRRETYRIPGTEIVPTVHPAYCLRHGDAFLDLVTDVGKLHLDPTPWTPPEWNVVDDTEGALHVISQLQSTEYDKLVVDIECGIDKDGSFDHPNHYQMLCIGVGYAKGKAIVFGEEALKDELVLKNLGNLFRAKKIIEQNGKFDNGGMYPIMGNINVWFDTMLAHYVLDERPGGHSLETLGIELLGTPDWKHEIAPYLGENKNYANIPRPILYKYNAYDIAITWDLFEMFAEKLKRPVVDPDRAMDGFKTLRDVHDFLCRASNELKFMELNGITFDKEYSRQLSEEYLGELSTLEEDLNATLDGKDYDARFGGINPRSPKQVKEYLYDQGIRVQSTDADTLTRLKARAKPGTPHYEFLDKLLQHRYKAKRHGTFIAGIRKRTYRGRIYTTYLLHGTTSGRLASRNPNLQNIVRDNRIRQQFTVSKPGNVLVQGDFKQAEGRVITTEAQDEYLRDIFADPERDLFDELGRDLYHHEAPFHKEERIRVKAYFYGLGYGRTAYSIGQEYGIPLPEAEEGVALFKDLIPQTVKWQLETQQKILDGEDLMTAFGRSRRFMLITKENRDDVLKEGLSFVPQSTSSDICLSAYIRLRPMLRGRAFFRLIIHDSLTAECAEEDADYVGQVMAQVMVEEAAKYTSYVPFEVDITTGRHWGEL